MADYEWDMHLSKAYLVEPEGWVSRCLRKGTPSTLLWRNTETGENMDFVELLTVEKEFMGRTFCGKVYALMTVQGTWRLPVNTQVILVYMTATGCEW